MPLNSFFICYGSLDLLAENKLKITNKLNKLRYIFDIEEYGIQLENV